MTTGLPGCTGAARLGFAPGPDGPRSGDLGPHSQAGAAWPQEVIIVQDRCFFADIWLNNTKRNNTLFLFCPQIFRRHQAAPRPGESFIGVRDRMASSTRALEAWLNSGWSTRAVTQELLIKPSVEQTNPMSQRELRPPPPVPQRTFAPLGQTPQPRPGAADGTAGVLAPIDVGCADVRRHGRA